MDGACGPIIGDDSMCSRVDNEVVSALFVTDKEGVAFISYVVTGKKYMRLCLATSPAHLCHTENAWVSRGDTGSNQGQQRSRASLRISGS